MSALFSDSDSNSSAEQAPVFARVLPDSPTPYTDATQVTIPPGSHGITTNLCHAMTNIHAKPCHATTVSAAAGGWKGWMCRTRPEVGGRVGIHLCGGLRRPYEASKALGRTYELTHGQSVHLVMG